MTKRVIADTLRLRSGPGTSFAIRAELVRGADVEVIVPGDWLFVKTASGAEGWVHGGYVVDAPAPAKPKWRTARALNELYDQANALAPRRSRKYDGTIGDTAHAERKSDHNPDENGVVKALDLTHDPANGLDAGKLAEAIRASRDERVAYVIHNGRIFSATVKPWTWRPYHGKDAHLHHAHISVVADPARYDDPRPWKIA